MQRSTIIVLALAVWQPELLVGHRPQERDCEGGEGSHCGLSTVSSAERGGGDEEKVPHFPLVLFIFAPLTRSAIEDFKNHIKARETTRVDIYASSDTLRCGQGKSLGGQLPSQVAGCKELLKELYNKPGEYANVFGDHLNQAWLADEWRVLMEDIKTLRQAIKVNVYIYPHELFHNPQVSAKLKEFTDPATFKNFENDSDVGREWNSMSVIQKYWYLWSLSQDPVKKHPMADLGVVVDFLLRHDDETREISLSHKGQRAEWCVAPPYKGDVKAMPMVYIDLENDQSDKYCQSQNVLASLTENVYVSLPRDAEKFETWLGYYKAKLDEVFNFKPSKIGFYNKIADRAIAMDVLIFQDGSDADDFGSVLWLLKSLRFQYTRLIVTNRPANFRIHKYQERGKKKVAIMEANESRLAKTTPHDTLVTVDDRPNYASVLNYYSKGKDSQLTDVGVAWPMLYSVIRNKTVFEGQKCYEEDDSSLVEKHTLWRWNQWLQRMTVLGVEVSGDGGARLSPLSHAVFPYTFYFYNKDAAFESPDFVVPYSTYAKKEVDEAAREKIWTNLQYVFEVNGQELQETAELQDSADSNLQPGGAAAHQVSIAVLAVVLCVIV